MRVRHKLNRSYFNGSLLLAGLIGWLGNSWIAFFVALVFLVGVNLAAREIRIKGLDKLGQPRVADGDNKPSGS